MKRFKGKKVLVTGSGRGLGRAIAVEFAKEGAVVAVNATTESSASKATEQINDDGGIALAFPADVSNYDSVVEMFFYIRDKVGAIDILVNNAGISPKNNGGRRKTILETPKEEWEQVVAVNLNGMFYCSQEALKTMVPNEAGIIINMTSIAAFVPNNITGAHYMATKAGVIGFTKALSGEYSEFGIRSNAVSPGRIMTEMVAGANRELNEGFRNIIPMKRFGLPEELAKAVLFLSSEDSSYISGTVIEVDGGGVKIIPEDI